MIWYDDELLPGDIVLFSNPESFVSRNIRRFTPRGDQEVVEATHVGIVTAHWPTDANVGIVEATGSGVKFQTLERAGNILVVRALGLSGPTRRAVAAKADSYRGRKYGYHKIIAQGIDYYLGRTLARGQDFYGVRRLLFWDKYPICSWVVASAYSSVGLHFGAAEDQATPHDIHAFAVTSGRYIAIGEQGQWIGHPPTIGDLDAIREGIQ